MPNPYTPYGGPEPRRRMDRLVEGREDLFGLMMPKTVVSLAVWIMMFGLGAGLAGLILFIVYQGQVNGLKSDLIKSQEQLRTSLEQRIQQIENNPSPQPSLNVSQATPPNPADQTAEVLQAAAPAVVGVRGIDASGKPTSGTGFIVNSPEDGTWVLTSYRLVAGAAGDVTKTVEVRFGNASLVSEVYQVDPGRDLALVIFRISAQRSLRFGGAGLKESDLVWAIGTAPGNPGAAAIASKVTTLSADSLAFDAQVPGEFVGGPLVNAEGRVVGVITAGGTPSKKPVAGAAPATGGLAVPVQLACQQVLRCPGSGRPAGAQSPSAAAPTGAAAAPGVPVPTP